MSDKDIRVPDLGDFSDVDVIEVHVQAGARVAKEDPLITLETDKATMDVPAPRGGTVESVAVGPGDKVSPGDVIATFGDAEEPAETPGETASPNDRQPAASPGAKSASKPGSSAGPAVTREDVGDADPSVRLVVLGGGPGGYTAAFRAADLGMRVALIERWPVLGGVCMNVGCIPSKALLHAARVIEESREMAECGIDFGTPRIDPRKLAEWKSKVVGQLARGLGGLARDRKVEVVRGTGRFVSGHVIEVEHEGERRRIAFEQCIIAAGSEPAMLPGLPDDPRIMDSSDALELDEIPGRLLVVGGGIIGLEMATVYEALGSKVSVAELTETLMPGCDPDLVRPLQKRIKPRYEAIMLGTRVTNVDAGDDGITVALEGDQAPDGPQRYDRVLVAIGRRANGGMLDADKAGVEVDQRGIITVDKQMRTNVSHIFAIGDIVGRPMLAHKASHEGKVAAEAAAGRKSFFDARVVPSVAYTDPEVAWVGLTEQQAKADGIEYEKGIFPWAASGRALSLGRSDGFTKLLFAKDDKRLLGAGIVGVQAGDLISEAALAIEMGCDAGDIGLTVHPHPTLSETVAFAAEAAEGTITDLYMPKR